MAWVIKQSICWSCSRSYKNFCCWVSSKCEVAPKGSIRVARELSDNSKCCKDITYIIAKCPLYDGEDTDRRYKAKWEYVKNLGRKSPKVKDYIYKENVKHTKRLVLQILKDKKLRTFEIRKEVNKIEPNKEKISDVYYIIKKLKNENIIVGKKDKAGGVYRWELVEDEISEC